MTSIVALSDHEIHEALKTLPHWHFEKNVLLREVECPSYNQALELVYQIGRLADRENHHPELFLLYKKAIIQYWTHTAGGVTIYDIEQAQKAENLIQNAGL